MTPMSRGLDGEIALNFDGAHDPQGLLSCLCRLDNRMPADFIPDADEHASAHTHLAAISPGD